MDTVRRLSESGELGAKVQPAAESYVRKAWRLKKSVDQAVWLTRQVMDTEPGRELRDSDSDYDGRDCHRDDTDSEPKTWMMKLLKKRIKRMKAQRMEAG